MYDDEGVYQRGRFTPLQAIPQVKQFNTSVQNTIQPIANRAASNFQGNIRNIRQDGWKNIQTAANPNKSQFFNQSLNAPGTTAPDLQKTLINRYGAPVLQIPYNIKQTFKKDSSLMDRASGALGTFGGVMAPVVDPTDLYFYGSDALKGYNASRIKGGNMKQNLQSAKQGLTGEKYFGLGDATTTNAGVGNALNMAEIPLLLAGGYAKAKLKGIGGKTAVKGTRQTIDPKTLEEVDGYRDYLNRAIKGEKVNPQEFNQVLNDIDNIVDKWLPKDEIDRIVQKSKGKATSVFYRNLTDAVTKKVGDYSEQYQGFRMGIKENNLSPQQQQATKKLPEIMYETVDDSVQGNAKIKPQQDQFLKGLEEDQNINYTPIRNTTIPPKVPKGVQQMSTDAAAEMEQIAKNNDVNRKVNLLDYFRTPEKVLQKMGLGENAKQIRKSYDQYQKDVRTEINRITEWQKRVPQEGSQERIFQYLDGQGVKLQGEELKVAEEMKAYLSEWADKLNLPQDNRIASYITHIFDKDFIEKEFDPELAKIIDDKIAGSVYDPFLQKRLGKMGYKQDVFAALDAYVKRATRKVNMDPALKKLSKAGDLQPLDNWKYIKGYVDRINMRPTDLDNLLDNLIKQVAGYKYGQRPVANISRKIRQTVYRAALGLNPGSALKNLSQGANTYAELGEQYTFRGYKQMLSKGTEELYRVGALADDMVQDRRVGVYKSALEKMDKTLFWMFEKAEQVNRGAAYYGGKQRALDAGKSEEEAIQAGLELVRKTQFTFGSIDTPQALNSDVAKLLTQFQSFTLKQGEFLGEKIQKKDIAGLLRYMGATFVFASTIGRLIGFDPEDAIPSLRFESPFTNSLQNTMNMLSLDEEKRKQGQKDTIKDLKLMFPAGVQAVKTGQYLLDRQRGYNQSASGRARFPVSSDPVSTARGVLFGSYNLPQSRQYFDSGESTLGDKQTELLRSLPKDQQQQYYDTVIQKRELKRNKEAAKEQGMMQMGIENPFESDTKAKVKLVNYDTPEAQPQGIQQAGIENPFKNFFGKKEPQPIDPEIAYEQAKIDVEINGEPQIVGNKALYPNPDGGTPKTIDFGKVLDMPTSSKADKAKRENEGYKLLDEVIESSLTDEQKSEVIGKLGINKEDARYYLNAKEPLDVKFSLIQDRISQGYDSQDAFLNDLSTWRKSVNGEEFLSNDLIDELEDNGDITNVEAKALKAITYNKITGKLEEKKSSGRKGTKLKLPKVSPVKLSPIRLSNIKIPEIKRQNTKLNLTLPKKTRTIRIKV